MQQVGGCAAARSPLCSPSRMASQELERPRAARWPAQCRTPSTSPPAPPRSRGKRPNAATGSAAVWAAAEFAHRQRDGGPGRAGRRGGAGQRRGERRQAAQGRLLTLALLHVCRRLWQARAAAGGRLAAGGGVGAGCCCCHARLPARLGASRGGQGREGGQGGGALPPGGASAASEGGRSSSASGRWRRGEGCCSCCSLPPGSPSPCAPPAHPLPNDHPHPPTHTRPPRPAAARAWACPSARQRRLPRWTRACASGGATGPSTRCWLPTMVWLQ